MKVSEFVAALTRLAQPETEVVFEINKDSTAIFKGDYLSVESVATADLCDGSVIIGEELRVSLIKLKG